MGQSNDPSTEGIPNSSCIGHAIFDALGGKRLEECHRSINRTIKPMMRGHSGGFDRHPHRFLQSCIGHEHEDAGARGSATRSSAA